MIGTCGDPDVDLTVNGTERLEWVLNLTVVPNMQPGEHQVTLVVEDNNDQSADGIAGATVNFTVLVPMPVPMYASNGDSPDPLAPLSEVQSRFAVATEGSSVGLPLGSDPFNPVEVSETRLKLPLRVDFGEPHPQVVLAPGADGAEVIGAEGNIASGELGGPSLGNDVPLALAPQNTSEAIGMELVRADDARTRIRIEVRRTEVDAVAMPEQS